MTTTTIQVGALAMAQQDLPQPQTVKPSQSFHDVMQAVQQKQATQANSAQQTQKTNQKQETNQKPETETTQETQVQQPVEDSMQTQEVQDGTITITESDESTVNNAVRTMLTGLFGLAAADIDPNQSDMDILKDLLGKLRDPEEKFAVMLMMAFLQENPDYTLNDLTAHMPEAGNMPALTGASPVNAVMNAMTKLMEADSNVKSFPLLDVAKQLQQLPQADKESVFAKQLSEMQAKVLSTPQAVQEQSKPQQDAGQSLLGQERFRGAVEQAKQAMQSVVTPQAQPEEKKSTVDVEQLQQQVNSGEFLRNTAIFTAKTAPTPVMIPVPEFVTQVRTGLLENLSTAKNEFIMQLKPEGLGELTVKLAEVAGKMTLTLTASNTQTQRLLESQIASLREVMKPYEVEVSQIVNGKDDAGERFGGAFGQQFGDHRHQEMEQHRQGGFVYEDEEVLVDEQPAGYAPDTEVLNTYI